MTPERLSTDSLAAQDETWDEIDRLVEEIARLARANLSPQKFYSELIERAVSALAASGGAAWLADADGKPSLVGQVNWAEMQAIGDREAQRRHQALVASVLEEREPRLLASEAIESSGLSASAHDALVLLAPIELESQALGVLEIVQRRDTSPSARQGQLRLLGVLAELAGEFQRQVEWREFRDRAALASQWETFTAEIHRSLDVSATAYAIANEGRRVLAIDRVSVLVAERGKCRMLATSGVDIVDRRANAVRTIEQLSAAVLTSGEPLWHTSDAAPLAPQIEQLLDSYIDESHARLVVIVPLAVSNATGDAASPGLAIGALAIERFDVSEANEALRRRVETVARHGALALGNAAAHERVPMVRTLERIERTQWFRNARGLPRIAWLAAGIIVAALALVFVEADFELEARGELQPQQRRDVFAPSDGIVDAINVEHGSQVSKGKVLVTLRKPELDVEFSRVLGDMETARKRLEGIQASRLVGVTTENDRRARDNQLTADEEETKERLKSLEAEHKVLLAQQAELQVLAPLDGVVVTWDVDRLLSARPVLRGQPMMTVAQTDGPWVLEARLSDDRVGPLLAAQDKLGEKLRVTFIVATDPGATYEGRVTRVALATEPNDKDEPTVLVTVDFDRDQLSAERRRPGATVIAKIDCGRRALGYVWFHELIHVVQTRLLF
jgi:multidrug efflux pump subunit AcrA (membrane-fusion protein)